mgnify:CR=1 FL=1
MTDEQIAEQIRRAVVQACRTTCEQISDDQEENAKLLVALYLSGANQMANYLVRTDGATTPQQMERAILLAGQKFGLSLIRPERKG